MKLGHTRPKPNAADRSLSQPRVRPKTKPTPRNAFTAQKNAISRHFGAFDEQRMLFLSVSAQSELVRRYRIWTGKFTRRCEMRTFGVLSTGQTAFLVVFSASSRRGRTRFTPNGGCAEKTYSPKVYGFFRFRGGRDLRFFFRPVFKMNFS